MEDNLSKYPNYAYATLLPSSDRGAALKKNPCRLRQRLEKTWEKETISVLLENLLIRHLGPPGRNFRRTWCGERWTRYGEVLAR